MQYIPTLYKGLIYRNAEWNVVKLKDNIAGGKSNAISVQPALFVSFEDFSFTELMQCKWIFLTCVDLNCRKASARFPTETDGNISKCFCVVHKWKIHHEFYKNCLKSLVVSVQLTHTFLRSSSPKLWRNSCLTWACKKYWEVSDKECEGPYLWRYWDFLN